MSEANAGTVTPTNDAGTAQGAESNTAAANGTTAASQTTDQGQTQAAQDAQQTGDQKANEPSVPESYTFEMPDGVNIDQAMADSFTAIAKEANLTQEQASKFTGLYAKAMQAQVEAHGKQVGQWLEQTKTDKEFGGDKLNENVAIAQKAIASFGSPELKTLLDSTGLGNHPEVIRAFWKAGKAISEDGFVGGRQAAGASLAERMFPSMKK